MIEIIYPQPQFQIKEQNGLPYIFDAIRRKWLVLQDEEWVRQNFVQYLMQTMQYPRTLIALEKQVKLGELTKRFDVLVYDRQHQPWMLIECKAEDITLSEQTLHQVLRYHISMPATYLVITNGTHTYGWEKRDEQLQPIHSLPEFSAHH